MVSAISASARRSEQTQSTIDRVQKGTVACSAVKARQAQRSNLLACLIHSPKPYNYVDASRARHAAARADAPPLPQGTPSAAVKPAVRLSYCGPQGYQGYPGQTLPSQPPPGPHPPFGARPPQGMHHPPGMQQLGHRPSPPQGMPPGGPPPRMPGMPPMHMGPPPGYMGMPYGMPHQYGMPPMGMRPPPGVRTASDVSCQQCIVYVLYDSYGTCRCCQGLRSIWHVAACVFVSADARRCILQWPCHVGCSTLDACQVSVRGPHVQRMVAAQMPGMPGMPGPPGGFPGRGHPSFSAAQRPPGPSMSQPQHLPGTIPCCCHMQLQLVTWA